MTLKKYLPICLLLSALLLSSCKFQAVTSIGPGGSGELRTEVGFSAEERANLESQSEAEPSDDFCNTSDAAQGTTVTEEQRAGETWCVTTRRFGNVDELRQLYQEKQGGVTVNRLEIADGRLHYDIDVATSSDDFANFESITWTLVLPSAPISHNATQADGNTLIWTLTPNSGTVNLRAESEASQPLGMQAVILGILVLAALIVVIGLAVRGLLAPIRETS